MSNGTDPNRPTVAQVLDLGSTLIAQLDAATTGIDRKALQGMLGRKGALGRQLKMLLERLAYSDWEKNGPYADLIPTECEVTIDQDCIDSRKPARPGTQVDDHLTSATLFRLTMQQCQIGGSELIQLGACKFGLTFGGTYWDRYKGTSSHRDGRTILFPATMVDDGTGEQVLGVRCVAGGLDLEWHRWTEEHLLNTDDEFYLYWPKNP